MGITEITYLWILIAIIILPINLIYKAPYGKHSTKKWGKSIDNKTGWILMEFPALITCPLVYFVMIEEINLSGVFIVLWIIHYFNRTIIYPLRIKTKGKKRGYVERQEIQHDGSIESKIIEWTPANQKE